MPETAAAVLETPATTTPPAAAATATPPPAVPPPATPPAAATPAAETEPARTAAEPAKAPEKYTLTLPAESPFVDADLAVFSAQAKALALTNDQAQALVNGHVETVRTLSAQYLAEAQADPEIGGTKFAETTALAIKGARLAVSGGCAGHGRRESAPEQNRPRQSQGADSRVRADRQSETGRHRCRGHDDAQRHEKRPRRRVVRRWDVGLTG